MKEWLENDNVITYYYNFINNLHHSIQKQSSGKQKNKILHFAVLYYHFYFNNLVWI